jgi:hypothetical protein
VTRALRVIERTIRTAPALPEPTPVLNRLYADARRTWLGRPHADAELHRLVMDLMHRRDEVSADEDRALRGKHGIRSAS